MMREGGTSYVPDAIGGAGEVLQALGIGDPRCLDVERLWAQRRGCGDPWWAHIPVGVKPDGELQNLVFRPTDIGGRGSHSAVIGASGSGKSTLFMSMVYSIALTHSPETFNVILVDPQHESIANRIRGLPHVVAAAAGLGAGDHTRAERLRDAIAAEIVRRYWLFASAGARDANEYEKIRLTGRDLEPLPILLVVVEDYPQLCSHHPLWSDLITEVGQMGRQANVFFMLGAQRWDTWWLPQVESSIGFRVALRAQSAADSCKVIGCDDAYHLPAQTGGFALMKSGHGEVEPFRCFDVCVPLQAPMTASSAGASRCAEFVSDTGHRKLLLNEVLLASLIESDRPTRVISWPDFEGDD